MFTFVKKVIKYILQKVIWRNQLSFPFDSNISMRSEFEGMNKIYSGVFFDGYLGYGSYIAKKSHIRGKIGKYTSIAPNCCVIEGIHPYTYPYVSTSPVFISLAKQNGCSFTKEQIIDEIRYADGNFPIVIGNDCWIGQNVSLIGGIKINDGAVVLAGAVVTKDVPAYSIVGGVPAKVIKYRYNESDIHFLQQFAWWNKGEYWLKDNISLFYDIELLKKYKDK